VRLAQLMRRERKKMTTKNKASRTSKGEINNG